MFLDNGAMVNVIGLKQLNKIKPGVKVIEESPYSVLGLTGDLLNTLGSTQLTVTMGGYFNFDIFAIFVEKPTFPGDLLIAFTTMRDQDIIVSPADYGAYCFHKFIPIINSDATTESLAVV